MRHAFTKAVKQKNMTSIEKPIIQFPVLETKLFIPKPRENFVHRPRLIKRLNEQANYKLSLISAPAGFGKTTLVSEWIANSKIQTAWFSLNEGDNDPTRFITYLVAAVQKIDPSVGISTLELLHSPRKQPMETVLTEFLNEINTIKNNFVLVLDDYHTNDSTVVDNAILFLLEHLPAQMHLMITTREDPQFPLSRMRARAQLNEIRAKDLRFTFSETAGFFKQVMGLDLSEKNIHTLEMRTEGWIAGLQLAALSIQGRGDINQFINTFAGHDRYIVDYLLEEVLERQVTNIRNFLLQTSCLERLNGGLCDAVTKRDDSKKTLENLERANLFVVPLDDKRQWYRYHHLFADVLHTHFIGEHPDHVSTIHNRASEWYEQNNFPADAIHHALAAENFERAGYLIELTADEIFYDGQTATLYNWINLLPKKLVRSKPSLSIWAAWRSLDLGDREVVDAYLNNAEMILNDHNQRNDPEKQKYSARLYCARAMFAQSNGDTESSVKYARHALELLPEDERFWRGGTTAILGLAFWTNGNLIDAHHTFVEGLDYIQEVGNIHFQIGATHVIADLIIAQGCLQDALKKYQHSLGLLKNWNGPVINGTADLYLGLSELYFEFNDLEAAKHNLLKGKELGQKAALPENLYRWRLCESRILETQDDLLGAFEKLEEAEKLFVPDAVPNIRPIQALKVKAWLGMGRLDDALKWVNEQGLPGANELSYIKEYAHLTMARVLITLYKNGHKNFSKGEAIKLLDRLLDAAENKNRTGSIIEILIVKALAHQAEGNNDLALKSLERVLALTEPEGYVRIFIDEGRPMSWLLNEASKKGIQPEYVGKLLDAFKAKKRSIKAKPNPEKKQILSGEISQRELEVLKLIADGFSNQQISDKLFLALSTVKGHNLKIFTKLQVTRRTEAVARARELGLI
jgi:ATP/maltotriose-dependent transcriptional regulator MalT